MYVGEWTICQCIDIRQTHGTNIIIVICVHKVCSIVCIYYTTVIIGVKHKTITSVLINCAKQIIKRRATYQRRKVGSPDEKFNTECAGQQYDCSKLTRVYKSKLHTEKFKERIFI